MTKTKTVIISLVILSALICVYPRQMFARLQSPPPIKLSVDASKAYIEIENRQREIVRQANEALQNLQAQKSALLIGAGVARAEVDQQKCDADPAGIVTCAKPSTTEVTEKKTEQKKQP